jgi:DNA-directed RNA polymerase subunit RPC12/RpoP
MSVKCIHCGREFAEALFTRDRVVMCGCGEWVEPEERTRARARAEEMRGGRADRAAIEDLARRADHITSLVLHSDLPAVDIAIEIAALREHVRERFPGREELFRMVYESRWERFREQGWARGGNG